MGKFLGFALLGCLMCTEAYFCSIFVHSEPLYAIAHGVYFSSITLILLALVRFTMLYTQIAHTKTAWNVWRVLRVVCAADILAELTNFLHYQCLTYAPIERQINHFVYRMGIGFQLHLLLSYFMLSMVAFMLIQRFFTAPRFYWRRYEPALAILVLVVGVNAIYLYAPESNNLKMVDYSLLGYSIGALCFYWMAFRYSKHGLARHYQSWVVSSNDMGILLFDMDGMLILHNKRAQHYFRTLKLDEDLKLQYFLQQTELNKTIDISEQSCTTQFYRKNSMGIIVPMRCEYKAMAGKNGTVNARLFSISTVVQEIDPLTGFTRWEYFLSVQNGTLNAGQEDKITCVLCDINGLSDINEQRGRTIGDQAIQKLAMLMRRVFPVDSLYLRCKEANVAVFCFGLDDAQCHERVQKLQNMLQDEPDCSGFRIQNAIQRVTIGSPAGAVEQALRIIRIKKLMDRTSNHSDTLNSIIQILQECDIETENHVRRTQNLCVQLGRKLGLTDDQLSHLSLLAILHDIGKVGVPLDILNKPGKLTRDEWRVIQSHTEKGARIAASSGDLADIGDMIRHHHERWDGQGYPSGLSKESIPLLSRIISVVDSYDAMVYNRSYRRCMPREKAMSELMRCAGSQFDPNIVSVFLEMLRDLPGDDSISASNEAQRQSTDDWTWRDTVPPADQTNVHTMNFASYKLSNDSLVLEVDARFTELTGYTPQDVAQLKLTQRDLIPSDDWDDYAAKVTAAVNATGTAYIEHRLLRKDGKMLRVFCLGRNYFDSATRTTQSRIYVTNVEDTHAVQKLLEAQHDNRAAQLQHWQTMYRKDPLTGLLSRDAFRNDVEHALLSNNGRTMMIMMDMDHFKQVNDRLGHRTGDEFLKLLGKTLNGLINPGELLSRMGGDEFAALLHFPAGSTDEDMISRGIELCEQLNLVISTRSQGISGVSCGGVMAAQGNTLFDDLYERADEALYLAKHRGRGCFCMYEEKKS